MEILVRSRIAIVLSEYVSPVSDHQTSAFYYYSSSYLIPIYRQSTLYTHQATYLATFRDLDFICTSRACKLMHSFIIVQAICSTGYRETASDDYYYVYYYVLLLPYYHYYGYC